MAVQLHLLGMMLDISEAEAAEPRILGCFPVTGMIPQAFGAGFLSREAAAGQIRSVPV